MATYFAQPAPTLIVNEETGDWVMTHSITRVISLAKEVEGKEFKSRIFVISDLSGGSYIDSPLTPKELHNRMFDIEQEDFL